MMVIGVTDSRFPPEPEKLEMTDIVLDSLGYFSLEAIATLN